MAGLLDFLTGGLLGGQPQQQQQPQGLFPGANDQTTAAFRNFGGGGNLVDRLLNAGLGATTGQRTDPVGMYQQMAGITYNALVQAGVPEPQARLGAINPEVQKAITAKMFPTYSAHNVGNTATSFNPATGQITPQYIAPEYKTRAPGEEAISYQPPLINAAPGPMGVPRPAPVQTAPLAPPPGGQQAVAPVPGGPGPSPGSPAPVGGMQVIAPGMTVAQKEEQTGLGKTWADLGKAIQTDAISARSVKSTISRLRQLNEQAPSGPTAEHWQNLLSATRIDPKTVAAGTEFQALSSKLVKDAAGGGLGPGFSEGDRRSIERQVPTLTQDKTGRKNLMDFHDKVADRQLKVQEMAAAWRNRPNNPTKSLEGFAEHIATYAEKNPLFPQPVAPTGGGGPPVGSVHNGYLFKGGNPNSQASWEKVI